MSSWCVLVHLYLYFHLSLNVIRIIKEDKMGRAHRKHREHLKEETQDGRVLTGIMWHRTCTRSRIFEDNHELPGSINYEELLH